MNVDSNEIQRFADLADDWWRPDGRFKPLHRMNPVRVAYIEQRLGALAGKRILDVGCGGGLLTEALARLGAQVTGIDAGEAAIEVARRHAAAEDAPVTYEVATAEQMAETAPGRFDAVTCLEMLEHVPDPAAVLAACARLLKPDGDLILSTLHRTPASFMLAIVVAEYGLGLLPRGTHEYRKFIRPSELADWLRATGLAPKNVTGLDYNPLTGNFRLNRRVTVNYLMHAQRDTDL